MNTPSKALAIAAAVILAAGTSHASPTGRAGVLPCSRIVAQAQKSPSDTQFAIVQWGTRLYDGAQHDAESRPSTR